MIFNMMAGNNPELEVISGSYTDLDRPQVLTIPVSVKPLMVVFKTIAGAGSELAVYYRTQPSGVFTLRTAGSCPASMRMYSDHDTGIVAILTGAGTANLAKAEYYIMGVKKT